MVPIRTILHPTDFSTQASQAFHLACALAHDYGANLVLIHVKSLPLIVGGEFGSVLPVDAPSIYAELRKHLSAIRPADSAILVEHHLREGDAASEILRLANECRCDLIVMGTHGRTGLGRLLVGSVAEAVLRKAACPVLTIKAPLPETASAARPRAAEVAQV